MQEREAELNGRYAQPVDRQRAHAWRDDSTTSFRPLRPGPDAVEPGPPPAPGPRPGSGRDDAAPRRDDDLPGDFFTGRGA
ncbi:hypothetical protein NBM05_11280 [Rothia sp. AR01]|uniref:Uncharacterized protein n=1 Tax=Rothia santali TaxID=2949643 RepID=A0A9X2HF55_9MICC|nr:hypothetical protein [Rothia santali]MCP3426567.1 hypothetical protein [Rothia santali]